MFRLVLPPLASNKELSRQYFKSLHKELRQISITEIIDVEQNISWKWVICRYMLKYAPTMFRLLVPPAHKLYKQLLIAANGDRTH